MIKSENQIKAFSDLKLDLMEHYRTLLHKQTKDFFLTATFHNSFIKSKTLKIVCQNL